MIKANDVYYCDAPQFEAPEKDMRRFVLVRRVKDGKVAFSAFKDFADNPEDPEEPALTFFSNAFVIPEWFFLEYFEFVSSARTFF